MQITLWAKASMAQDWPKTFAKRTISLSTTTPRETKSISSDSPGARTLRERKISRSDCPCMLTDVVNSIAGLLAEVGVCTNSMMDQFLEMYIAYKKKKPWQKIADTDWGRSTTAEPTLKETNGQYWLQKGKGKEWLAACEKPDIQVVGVFDTVGALGWPDGTLATNPFWKNSEHGFHNTDIHPAIKNAFHALAIDEHRRPFTPTLWHKPDGSTTNLIQCWFPGVHINIGGGSDDALRELTKQLGDLEGMANVSLAWMVDRVREFTKLKFNDNTLDIIVARYMDNSKSNNA